MRVRLSSHDKYLALCGVIAVILILIAGLRMPQAQPKGNTAGEWRNYAGDKANSKYSPLAQINKDNFKSLKIAWTWRSADEEVIKANPHLKTWVWELTPLMVGGVLYVSTSLSQVAAIDAATGKTRWVYDPETWKARHTSESWLCASRRRLLGGWERSTNPVWHRRRLPDLPERTNR